MIKLTEDKIKRNFPVSYYERGYDYYLNGNIINPVIRENKLEALCEGSYAEPYRVSVTLDSDNDFSKNTCSCPIGGGCKHVIALLLTCVNEKEKFLNLPPVDSILKNKTKEELLSIIKEMLNRYPELINVIERSDTVKSSRKEKVNPEIYRRQIREAMEYTDNWHNRYRGANEIASVIAIGDKFLENSDYENAFIVYDAAIQETLDNYYMVHDEGEIASEIDSAIEELSVCLSKQEEGSESRLKILKDLFNVKKWDIEQGGFGIGDEVPVILNNAMSEGVSSWGQDAWGYFLLTLFDADNNDEGFLKKAEELDLYKPMFDKLVLLKRIDRAIEIARNHLTKSDWDRLNACKKFAEIGFIDEALAFALEGLSDCKDNRLKEWLAEIYEKQKEYSKSLDLYLQIWEERPGLKRYKNIKRLAGILSNWSDLKKELIQGLEEKTDFDLLAEIFLFEKDWNTAWNYADKIQRSWMSYSDIKLKLAEAFDKDCPDRAIKVYLDYAERLINRRGRGNYAEAASYLKKILNVYSRIGDRKTGRKIIADIRIKYCKLPALRDEMNKAEL